MVFVVAVVPVHTAEGAALGFASAPVRNAVLGVVAVAAGKAYTAAVVADKVCTEIAAAGKAYIAAVADSRYMIVQEYTEDTDNTPFAAVKNHRVLTDV